MASWEWNYYFLCNNIGFQLLLLFSANQLSLLLIFLLPPVTVVGMGVWLLWCTSGTVSVLQLQIPQQQLDWFCEGQVTIPGSNSCGREWGNWYKPDFLKSIVLAQSKELACEGRVLYTATVTIQFPLCISFHLQQSSLSWPQVYVPQQCDRSKTFTITCTISWSIWCTNIVLIVFFSNSTYISSVRMFKEEHNVMINLYKLGVQLSHPLLLHYEELEKGFGTQLWAGARA